MIVILYTLYPADPDTGATVVYRAATAGYRSWPTDDPANAVWPPLVTKRGDLLVQAPAPGEGRRTQAAEGRLQLSNAFDRQRGARPLSALADLVTHGKRILVQAVDARAPYSTAVTIFDGVMGAVDVSRSELTVNFKDRSADYDAPLLTEVYGGGGGLDGGASLKGKTKERCFGAVALLGQRRPCD